jgi:serine/threonine-protein kinase
MSDILGGRYKLLDPLGRGGMGIVYEAVQEGLGRRVAIKILDARLSEDREQLERFRREAEVVAALGHPNIVQVTDFQYPEKDGDQPFIVMELLRGESLGATLAREQVLTAQRAAFVGAQVLSALIAAHRAGVVHRDIKPDNIFLLSDAAVPDTVKVLDFGIAKLAVLGGEGQQKLTGTGAMLGTPAFMAPEQARGEPDVDARADVYAVGATLYQALSGRLPHDAPSIPALLFAIVEKMPPPLRELRPDLPAELSNVIERAMAKDRNARFADADAMRRALAPWSGLPASIPPPTSGTAATIASGSVSARDQPATPIVVHHTPAPANIATTPSRARSTAATVMIGIAALFAILGATTIGILWVVMSHAPAASSIAPTQDSSHVAAPPPLPSIAIAVPTVDVPAIVASAMNVAHVAPQTPTEKKRYGGAHGRFGGADFGGCKACGWEAFIADVNKHEPAIAACFAASVHEPPHHETPYYVGTVSADGVVTDLHATGDGAPNLDRCIARVLQSIPVTMSSHYGGTFKMSFMGECKGGMANLPGSCD